MDGTLEGEKEGTLEGDSDGILEGISDGKSEGENEGIVEVGASVESMDGCDEGELVVGDPVDGAKVVVEMIEGDWVRS